MITAYAGLKVSSGSNDLYTWVNNMSISSNIIDQRVRKVSGENESLYKAELGIQNDPAKANSVSFVFLAIKTFMQLSDEDALDSIVEGGADFGIDAIYLTPPHDGEFVVTLVQGKYKQNPDNESNFPENGVKSVIDAIRILFDPSKVVDVNKRLRSKIEEVRSLVAEGEIPKVHAILCSNGKKWNSSAENHIQQTGFGDQVTWQYVGPDELISVLQAPKKVNDTLQLSGKAFVEEFDFRRALIGRIPVGQLAALFDRHGDRLLERNIRRYLGLSGNRVNEAVASTLRMEEQRQNFYFYNNGITIICSRFRHNALQQDSWQVQIEGLQIVNGGQTSRTVQQIVKEIPDAASAQVLIRIYELPEDDEELVKSITYATNSQNPVDLRDLRSNDSVQKMLSHSIEQLGYVYRRQRGDSVTSSKEITSTVAAEGVLAVWRHRPHQARFMATEHFGKLYDKIFTSELNGSQLVIAALILRFSENKRKRPPENAPDFLPYASRFIAMLMGNYLLKDIDGGIKLKKLDHKNFEKASGIFQANAETYFARAIAEIEQELNKVFDCQPRTLQRLSATFRRADLVENILGHPLVV